MFLTKWRYLTINREMAVVKISFSTYLDFSRNFNTYTLWLLSASYSFGWKHNIVLEQNALTDQRPLYFVGKQEKFYPKFVNFEKQLGIVWKVHSYIPVCILAKHVFITAVKPNSVQQNTPVFSWIKFICIARNIVK